MAQSQAKEARVRSPRGIFCLRRQLFQVRQSLERTGVLQKRMRLRNFA